MFDRVGYRELPLEQASLQQVVLAICRWNLRMVIRQKLFWLLVALGLLSFIVFYVLIYIKAQISVESPQIAQFIDRFQVTGTGEGYRQFLETQSRAILILLAYAGVVLVAGDYRSGGISFYLSKPIGKLHYVAGKTLALLVIVGLLTLLPGIILFLEYGLFTNSAQYWIDNWRILAGIVGYSLLIMIVPSLLVLALGAVCRRGAALVLVWCSIFLVLPIFGSLLRAVFNNNPDWLLLNLWRNLELLGKFCFGDVDPKVVRHGWPALGIVLGVCAGSIGLLHTKLKAVEVVE
jgi:ABC-type transport system involved in multi-copper enzyme maturation permease subunit